MYAVHPRPPSPRGAAGPRNRGLCGLPCAAVFGLGSRSPRQAMGRTQRNEGEKKIKALEIWATQKSSLKFRNIVVLSWLKNHEKSVDYLVN